MAMAYAIARLIYFTNISRAVDSEDLTGVTLPPPRSKLRGRCTVSVACTWSTDVGSGLQVHYLVSYSVAKLSLLSMKIYSSCL